MKLIRTSSFTWSSEPHCSNQSLMSRWLPSEKTQTLPCLLRTQMPAQIRCPVRMRQTIVPLRIEYRVQKKHLSWKGLENFKWTPQTVGIQTQKPYFIDLCLMYLRPVCMAYLLTLTGSAFNKNFTQFILVDSYSTWIWKESAESSLSLWPH